MPITEGVTDGYGPVLGAPARDYSEVSDLDFMSLLVAQIQNQDPLSPMDNAEFTSQITQFSMLDELTGMQTLLEENLAVGQSINNTSMLALVGKNVTVEGDTVSIADGETSENMLTTSLPGMARIEVTDSSGKVVRTYTKEVEPGMSDVSWDGKDGAGNVMDDGDYTISVTVMGKADGAELPFTTLMTRAVEGMRYENNIAVVMLGGQDYYVTDIYKVS